jgi:Uncharacterized protein conserved in bacteria
VSVSATYAVIYSYIDDDELREKTRPAHREYLQGLAEEGALLVAGAWAPSEPAGGLLIFRAPDKQTVEGYVDRDPYKTEGVLATCEIREWAPPLGPVAPALNGE